MPASKDINHYTQRWMDLFDAFQDDPTKEVVVECDSVKEAKRVRLEFYKARSALLAKEAKIRTEANLRASDEAKQTYEMYGHPNLDFKEVTIVGTNVIFGYRDKSRVAELLERALAKIDNNEAQHDNGQ